MSIHRQQPTDTIIKTTVFVKIPVTIEIEVRVLPDGCEPTIDDFEWGDRIIEVDHHWTYDQGVCDAVVEACRDAIAAHKQKGTV